MEELGNSNRPMIIAMKGIPSKSKSRLALSVAKKLRCPFMDHDDLLPALQQCLPLSLLDLHDLINNFSLEALCRIAQSQLFLKLNVIFNSPLSDPTHFDQLVHLAASNDSTLLLINCRSQQESSSSQDYDVGGVRKLIIDLTDEQGKEDELVINVLQFIRSSSDLPLNLSINSDLANAREEVAEEETDSEDDDDPKLLKDFAHSDHPLVFCDDDDENNYDRISCEACLEPICGQIYRCVECKFYLHKSCAELPRKTNSPIFGKSGPLYLNLISGSVCWACGFQQGNCIYLLRRKTCSLKLDFSLKLDPECVKSPSVLEREFHQHKLYLGLTGCDNCNACGKESLPIQYSCSECSLTLHVQCALLPTTIKHECHCEPLTLTPLSASLDEECYCDVCETRREPNQWYYYCSDCGLAAHLSCVFPDPKYPFNRKEILW